MAVERSCLRSWHGVTALVAASALVATGCGVTGVDDVSLPGGADLGNDPIEMTVEFRDALDLVPQGGVKANEVDVGRVEDVELADDAWHAEVTLLVNRDADMPANPDANIRQSSLLGEKYVELVRPPEEEAHGTLEDGAHIPVSDTDRSVEVEEVLGALSLLLNGGGVEQINDITQELNDVAFGNEDELRAFLQNAEDLTESLDGQTDEITDALDGLNRLSGTLNEQKELITEALDDLGPGAQALEEQRGDLVEMLEALDELSEVAVDTVTEVQDDFVANLESLEPILRNLADTGADLPNALEVLLTFPFVDGAIEGIEGDYVNLFATIDANVQDILETFGRFRGNPFDGLPILSDLPIGEDELIDPSLVLPLPETESPESGGEDAETDDDAGDDAGDGQDPPESPGVIGDLLSEAVSE